MPTHYRQSVRKSRKNRVILTLLALVLALAVALCAVTVIAVLKTGDIKDLNQNVADQQASISALESRLEQATDAQASHQAVQESQADALESQLLDANGIIASQSEALQEQSNAIVSLQTELDRATATTAPTTEESDPTADKDADATVNTTDSTAQKTTKKTTTYKTGAVTGYYGEYQGKKLVALTFDDGPGPYTERLLDEMQKRDVKATFFVLGNRVGDYPELIKRMDAEGHSIGNHSYSHPNLTKLSYSAIAKNMNKTADKIEDLIGRRPDVMRCPGGSCNDNVKKYAKSENIPIIYWGVDTRDWESRNVNAIMKKSFGSSGISDGSIVLMHDIHKTSVDATIKMMDRLIDEGYTFVTVPELLMARHNEIRSGVVYY